MKYLLFLLLTLGVASAQGQYLGPYTPTALAAGDTWGWDGAKWTNGPPAASASSGALTNTTASAQLVSGNGQGLTNVWVCERIYFGDNTLSTHNSSQAWWPLGAFVTENLTLASTPRTAPHTSGYYSNITILHATFTLLSGTNHVVGLWTNIGTAAPIVSQLVTTLNGDGATLTTNSGTAFWPCPNVVGYVAVIGEKFNTAIANQLVSGYVERWHQTQIP